MDLYLIIHNIDGNNLRDANVQNMLSELASNDFIHILASVDHLNSSLCKYKLNKFYLIVSHFQLLLNWSMGHHSILII